MLKLIIDNLQSLLLMEIDTKLKMFIKINNFRNYKMIFHFYNILYQIS